MLIRSPPAVSKSGRISPSCFGFVDVDVAAAAFVVIVVVVVVASVLCIHSRLMCSSFRRRGFSTSSTHRLNIAYPLVYAAWVLVFRFSLMNLWVASALCSAVARSSPSDRFRFDFGMGRWSMSLSYDVVSMLRSYVVVLSLCWVMEEVVDVFLPLALCWVRCAALPFWLLALKRPHPVCISAEASSPCLPFF